MTAAHAPGHRLRRWGRLAATQCFVAVGLTGWVPWANWFARVGNVHGQAAACPCHPRPPGPTRKLKCNGVLGVNSPPAPPKNVKPRGFSCYNAARLVSDAARMHHNLDWRAATMNTRRLIERRSSPQTRHKARGLTRSGGGAAPPEPAFRLANPPAKPATLPCHQGIGDFQRGGP